MLCKDPVASDEIMGPILANYYNGESGSLISELESRQPHQGPTCENDNAAVCTKIEESDCGTSVDSAIKYFFRRKNGRGAFQALTDYHAGEFKRRSISKKLSYLLQIIK